MPFMSNTTSQVLSWSWTLMSSTPSVTSTPRQWSTGRASVQLDTTRIIPSRASVAARPCIHRRIRCSTTYNTREAIATAVGEVRRAQGGATVLGIGTANPASCLPQEEYVDWYFCVTKHDHLTKLKSKMKKICHKSGIKKRYFHHTEDTILDHPEFIDRALPSLDARQSIVANAVPELAAAAAAHAIAEWGRPAADVSHLVFATNSGAHIPGADLRLASLLGLRASVQRTMIYLSGCHAGSAALRVAKDMAENNRGARVLVVCGDLSIVKFRAPHEDHPETLVLQSLFGDGAGAVVVGAAGGGTDASAEMSGVEYPLFEMVSASQTVVPNSEDAVTGQVGEGGLVFSLSPKLPALVREHIEQCLADAVGPLGVLDGSGSWNDLFWAVHPGGPAILDSVQAALALAPSKLAASRHVLSEYGNMSGASVIFVLDELRRRHDELDHGDFGVMVGLGPGLTVETMVLRAASAATKKLFR